MKKRIKIIYRVLALWNNRFFVFVFVFLMPPRLEWMQKLLFGSHFIFIFLIFFYFSSHTQTIGIRMMINKIWYIFSFVGFVVRVVGLLIGGLNDFSSCLLFLNIPFWKKMMNFPLKKKFCLNSTKSVIPKCFSVGCFSNFNALLTMQADWWHRSRQ